MEEWPPRYYQTLIPHQEEASDTAQNVDNTAFNNSFITVCLNHITQYVTMESYYQYRRKCQEICCVYSESIVYGQHTISTKLHPTIIRVDLLDACSSTKLESLRIHLPT